MTKLLGASAPNIRDATVMTKSSKSPNTPCPGSPHSEAVPLLTSVGQDPIPGRRPQPDRKNEFWYPAVCSLSQHSVSLPTESRLVFYLKETLKTHLSSEGDATATQKGGLSNKQTLLGDFMLISDIYSLVLATPGLRASRSTCLCFLPPHCPSMFRWSPVAPTLPLTRLPAKVDHLMSVCDTYN